MMLSNQPNIVANLNDAGAQLHIIGKKQNTSDLPEHLHMKGTLIEGTDIDARTRGLGGILASCGEENLLRLKVDRYRGRDICVHELAHTILRYGLCDTTRAAVINQHKWSVHKGLWTGCYAATNFEEFFADLAMWYFGTAGDPGQIAPPPGKGPEWLRQYDLDAFAILDDIFSGRAKVESLKWESLPAIPFDQGSHLLSEGSNQKTQIRFVNESPEKVKIYWLDFQGNRNLFLIIDSGETFSQVTFTGHAWLITDTEELEIAIYVASEFPGVAIIGT